MKLQHLLRSSLILGLGVAAMGQQPPRPKQIPKKTQIHGVELVDPFAWMRDRKDPDTLAYLKAENAYAEGWMKPTKKLQQTLYREMLSRIQENDQRAPYRQGEFGYFGKTVKGKDYPILCRRPWNDPQARPEVLLDINQLAQGKEYYDVDAFEVSPDGRWLAYSVDETGYRQYRLHFKDLKTGKHIADHPERVHSVFWAQDNQTVYYVSEDPVTKRWDKFWQHRLGQPQSTLIYHETDELFDLDAAPSRDHTLALLSAHSKTSSECRYRPNTHGPAPLQILRAREAEHEYTADFWKGHFYIRTNRGAPMFKLVRAGQEQPDRWEDLLVPEAGTQVEEFCIFPDRLAILLRRQGSLELTLLDGAGQRRDVHFPESVRSLSFAENEDPRHPAVRVEYESPVTPPTTYDVDLHSGALKTVRRQPVPNYQASRYACQRWLVKARDGVEVPVTLVYRADLKPGGQHPTLLEGYGSYGAVYDPGFSSNRFSLLDRGVLYAYAHIRGGGELGEPWRQAGRMERKQNTFHDFVDCGQALVDSGWTRPDGLVITGASAGGLLMGAVSNERPGLFRAVISHVPFVDVMNTMLDASLPLTTSEYLEWGNPNEQAAFTDMLAYSPYDNLKAQAYPSMLVEVSLNDSQVPYWEGAKYVAKLRTLKTDSNPVLLKTNLAAGHGGASGRYARLRERAYDYAYALWQLQLFTRP